MCISFKNKKKTPGHGLAQSKFRHFYENDISMKELCRDNSRLYRGSYMSAHVLLNLLNELGKRDKMRGLPSILSLFRNEFNKFNNTRARMLESIYHMIKSHFRRKNVIILSS